MGQPKWTAGQEKLQAEGKTHSEIVQAAEAEKAEKKAAPAKKAPAKRSVKKS